MGIATNDAEQSRPCSGIDAQHQAFSSFFLEASPSQRVWLKTPSHFLLGCKGRYWATLRYTIDFVVVDRDDILCNPVKPTFGKVLRLF